MYVSIYVCMYVCIYVGVSVDILVYALVTYVHTHLHEQARDCTCAYIRMPTYTHERCSHTSRTNIYIHICTYIQKYITKNTILDE